MNLQPADQQINLGRVTLNYRSQGTGEQAVICIHGVGSSLLAWEEVVSCLHDSYKILTFDMRGHGKSTLVKGFYDIDEIVDEVIALADHVGFTSFSLAGFSLGGLIAQRLTLRYPERVKSLILLSTVAGRNQDEKARVAARLEALKNNVSGSHYDSSLSRWLTEDFQRQNPELIKELRARNASNDPECYASAYRVLAETDFGDEITHIACPTLISTGEEDSGSNPRMARFMHDQISGSVLFVLPGLRHSILTEAPKLVANMMDEFMRTAAGGERNDS
ncbi:alpha/beta fold hydrolase [Pseudomonas sp. DSP3-2-2]|uniref:alpha/beta fold hydrolase n=1 Tax=unclassified Pseudomonas TaxID=196821 RepID=UPI003CF79E7B